MNERIVFLLVFHPPVGAPDPQSQPVVVLSSNTKGYRDAALGVIEKKMRYEFPALPYRGALWTIEEGELVNFPVNAPRGCHFRLVSIKALV